MKVIGVKFRQDRSSVYNSKEYYYRADTHVPVGEFVIVDTSNTGLQVALVTSNVDDPETASKATKHIVQVVDLTQYNRIKEYEKKCKELKSLLDERVKSLQETAVYEMLAEKDLVLASLLSEYKNMLDSMQ